MNNKGQVLVIFVIILPVMLLALALLIDLGLMYIEKRKIDSNVYNATLYYLENQNDIDVEEKTKKLLKENINDIDIIIDNKDNYIELKITKQYKNIIKDKITIVYKGLKENKKIIKG